MNRPFCIGWRRRGSLVSAIPPDPVTQPVDALGSRFSGSLPRCRKVGHQCGTPRRVLPGLTNGTMQHRASPRDDDPRQPAARRALSTNESSMSATVAASASVSSGPSVSTTTRPPIRAANIIMPIGLLALSLRALRPSDTSHMCFAAKWASLADAGVCSPCASTIPTTGCGTRRNHPRGCQADRRAADGPEQTARAGPHSSRSGCPYHGPIPARRLDRGVVAVPVGLPTGAHVRCPTGRSCAIKIEVVTLISDA